MSLCETELASPSSKEMVTSLQDVPITVPRSVVVAPQQTRSPTRSVLDWSPVILLFRYDSQPTFARPFLGGRRKYFSSSLDRLPYLWKSSAFARGTCDLCVYLFWI